MVPPQSLIRVKFFYKAPTSSGFFVPAKSLCLGSGKSVGFKVMAFPGSQKLLKYRATGFLSGSHEIIGA
jgi:hypothetical protein